jgi:23S rRNA pseudouridine1911/1915/1917 synthase
MAQRIVQSFKKVKNKKSRSTKKSEREFLKRGAEERKRPVRATPPLFRFGVKEESTLLAFLMLKLPKFGRNKIKGYLSRRQILVNGAPVTQFDFPLSSRDEVSIEARSQKTLKTQKLDVIYEDDELIAINKPHGLLSVASDKEKGITAYRLLSDYIKDRDKHARIYVVHRIDKETSGVLLFAKNEAIKDELQKNWNDIVTKRGYYAITSGVPAKKEDTLKNFLFKNATNLMYVGHKSETTVLAITHYQVIRSKENYALLDIDIDTGKKNQIRVQMKHAGYPLIGDDKYDNKDNPLHRLGLHAYELDLIHPITHKKIKIVAKMPKEFDGFLKK